MTHKLIVNTDGHLSALPTQDEFSLGGFASSTDRFVCYDVAVDPLDFLYIYEHRDSVLVIAPDLPIKTPSAIVDPNWAYVQVLNETPLRLVPVYVPDTVHLAFARALCTVRLNTSFVQKKQGRFVANGHWYDGGDFLLFALAFMQRNQPGLFACAPDETAPFTPVMHTVVQMQAAAEAFAGWYQGLQAVFYEKQNQLIAATTSAQIDAISWI